MALFRKKSDPISDRARLLSSQIAQVEAEIKRLDDRLQQRSRSEPRLRSTAVPHGATLTHVPTLGASGSAKPAPAPEEPIFEDVDQHALAAHADATTTPDHYNELGVRKYDFTALIRRMRSLFRGPSTTNPKLVSYLAAGGIQGLRPLRYEKRVARNRFILLVAVLFFMLLGLIWVFLRRH
jgi:hypothetical protein